MNTIDRDAYLVIHVTVPSGFEFLIPARGYNLKSWLNFEKNLGSTCTYEETTEEAYYHLVWGDPNDPLGEKYGPESKRAAQQENPPKRGSRKAKSKDSETVRTPRKRTASTSKAQPTVVRESKVRDVRKSKKDVQGTNDSGKATPTRTRRSRVK